jgi:hypothetical protein
MARGRSVASGGPRRPAQERTGSTRAVSGSGRRRAPPAATTRGQGSAVSRRRFPTPGGGFTPAMGGAGGEPGRAASETAETRAGPVLVGRRTSAGTAEEKSRGTQAFGQVRRLPDARRRLDACDVLRGRRAGSRRIRSGRDPRRFRARGRTAFGRHGGGAEPQAAGGRTGATPSGATVEAAARPGRAFSPSRTAAGGRREACSADRRRRQMRPPARRELGPAAGGVRDAFLPPRRGPSAPRTAARAGDAPA